MQRAIYILLFLLAASWAQSGQVRVAKDRNDGNPIFWLDEEIEVTTDFSKLTKKEQRKFQAELKRANKLRLDVRRVYHLAKISGKLLNETNAALANMSDEKEKRKYVKKLEKELKARYEGQLRKLTLKQGKILIKLIHRETDNTAFSLIKEYRSGASALFWQALARFFGANLKAGYHPDTDPKDAKIEYIVRQIETGIDQRYY